MKVILSLVAGVALLAVFSHVSADPVIDCLEGDVIKITVNTTTNPELAGFYVGVLNEPNCNSTSIEPLVDTTAPIQMANITCYNYTLTESFLFVFLANNTILANESQHISYNLTCYNIPFQNSTENLTVTARPTTATLNGTYNATVEATLSGTNPRALGELLFMTYVLPAQFRDEVVIQLYSVEVVEVSADGALTTARQLIVDGACVVAGYPNVNITIRNVTHSTIYTSAAVEIELTWRAFHLFGLGLTIAKNYIIYSSVKVCPLLQADQCFSETGCNGDPKFGRRKRQAEEGGIQFEDFSEVLQLFPTEEAKIAYIDQIMQDNGISRETEIRYVKNEDEMCMNKTVSGVLLAFVLIVMLCCLISTVFMVFKTRRGRERKSDLSQSYSNKAF